MTTRGSRRLRRADPKVAALQATGTLNRRPEAVTDPLFRTGGLFDPRDLLQVRYGAAASRRGRTGCRNGAIVRGLAADGLSGPRGLQSRRACRSAAQAAWAEAWAQAYTGGPVAYRAEAAGTSQFARRRFGGGPAAHVRSDDPSPQSRAAAHGPKKTSEHAAAKMRLATRSCVVAP